MVFRKYCSRQNHFFINVSFLFWNMWSCIMRVKRQMVAAWCFFSLDARNVKVPKILICFPTPLNRLESPLFLGFIVYIFWKILFILIKFSQFLWKSVNISHLLDTCDLGVEQIWRKERQCSQCNGGDKNEWPSARERGRQVTMFKMSGGLNWNNFDSSSQLKDPQVFLGKNQSCTFPGKKNCIPSCPASPIGCQWTSNQIILSIVPLPTVKRSNKP